MDRCSYVIEEGSPKVIIQTFDLAREDPVYLPAAAQRLGRTVATVTRWILFGVKPRAGMRGRAIQLQACYVGDRLATSIESIVRFSDKLTNSYDPSEIQLQLRPEDLKRASHLAAQSQLSAAGY